MSSDSPDIFDAAMNLPDSQRASLAYQLLQSLKPPGVLSAEDSGFDAELEKRAADYDAGKTKASDWSDVSARLKAKLQERSSS
jgi:putative addiction module component (TIGR02574 family)